MDDEHDMGRTCTGHCWPDCRFDHHHGPFIISAVSGVGRGVKYLSNLNLVLSLVLLFTFVVFGSFLFAMTTYATAFVDYVLHFISLSFGAYGSQSAADFAAALPSEAAPFADALRGGATNA